MIAFNFTWWQLIIVNFFVILCCFLIEELIKFGVKVLFTTKWVVAWNLKRQKEQKKLIQKTQLQQMGENIAMMEQFIDWVEKQVPKNQHKQFWRDFSDNKETRNYWIKTLRDLITLKEKELDKPEVKKEVPKGDNNDNKGTMQKSSSNS